MTNWEFLTWNSNKYVSYKISSKADNKSDKPTCKFENYWKMELGKVCLLQAGVFPTTQNLKLLFSQNCCIFIEIINISSWDDVIQHCWDLVDWNLLRIVWENRICKFSIGSKTPCMYGCTFSGNNSNAHMYCIYIIMCIRNFCKTSTDFLVG